MSDRTIRGLAAPQPHGLLTKKFRVSHHPSGRAEAVKQRWSWPASLFSVFWAPFKGLWALGVSGLLAMVSLGYLVALFTDANTTASIMNLELSVAGILFGLKGNAWREAHLISHGFVALDTVTAENMKSAVAHFENVKP